MKKRLIFISLTLVLILAVLAPSAALARHGGGYHGQSKYNSGDMKGDFSGSGWINVNYMPDPVVKGPVWRYQGEIVEGFLDQCDWDLLAGTVFWSQHDSTVRVDEEYNASGIMRGTFSLTRPDGSGSLTGSFTGRIRGNLYTGDIYDEGSWRSTGGTGCFEGVRAWGKWSAELHFGEVGGQMTLVGPMIWSGTYMLKQDAKHDIKEISWQKKDQARRSIERHVTKNIRDKIRDSCNRNHRNW
jgi:hypothetical protein